MSVSHIDYLETAEAEQENRDFYATFDPEFDQKYEDWKHDMGLDVPLTNEEIEQIARYELCLF